MVDPATNADSAAQRTITTSTVDLHDVGSRLAPWLQLVAGADDLPVLAGLRRPQEAGMSSLSLLFDASWTVAGVPHEASLVARLAPESTSFPVFATYDLPRQYAVMRAVNERSDVPVPPLYWCEPSASVLGTPFLVMGRVAGRVPMDNPPYVFGGWLYDLTVGDRKTLQDATVAALAALHAIEDPAAYFPDLARDAGDDALRSHVAQQRAYYAWTIAQDGVRIPLLERAFDWLEAHWPAEPGPSVLSWGDARIGNVLYDGLAPAAVLDWEMAALGPRELDLGWFVFMHRFFQDIAAVFELPGLPDLCRRDDVVARYQRLTGHEVRDLDFYLVYAGLRHGIVMSQVKRRSIHFGEDQVPANPDGYILHGEALQRLLEGSYDWSAP